MATLAPNLQTQGDPEYLRYSHPISSVSGDKSGEILMKGLGSALDEGVQTADKLVGKYAENKAYEEGQKAEEAKKADIYPLWKQLTGNENTALDPKSQGLMSFTGDETGSLIQNNPELPPEIKYGQKQASSLNEKFVNGKLSQTQYDMEIDSLAKDLNSRFPAYHNQIAQGLSRATGRANANKTASDMISDINRIMSKANEEKNKVDSHVMNTLKDVTDPQLRNDIIQRRFGLQPGQPGYMSDTEALSHSANAQSFDINQQRLLRTYELNEKNNTANVTDATHKLNESLSNTASQYLHNVQVANGAQTWDQMVERAQKLRDNPNDPEGIKVVNDMRRTVELMEKEMQKTALPYGRTLGGSTQKMIDERMTYFKQLATDMGDPQKAGSAVAAAQQAVSAMERQAQFGIAKSPIGQQIVQYNAMTKLSPELSKMFMDQFMSVNKDAGPRIGDLFKNAMQSSMGTSPNDPNHKSPVIAQAIDQAKAMGASPKTLKGYIDFVGNISNLPNDQARNLAYAYFNPENLGMVSKWSRDVFDPRTGKTSEGQVNVLQTLGSKAVADKIYSLEDRQLVGYYKNFMETAFAHSVFPTILTDTRDMSIAAGDRLRYNDKTANFDLDPKGTGATSTYVRNTVKQLNFAIDTMKNIAVHEKKDPNEYLIGLIRAGDPEAFSREIPGFPGEINKAIAQQALMREMQKKQEEASKKKAIELSK